MDFPKSKHALVFGASGVAGWGVVDQLLRNYPEPETFARVTALVNRPLMVEDCFWPVDSASSSQPKFSLVSGIDLLQGSGEDVAGLLARKVKDIDTVTHVFYFAYKQNDDQMVEFEENKSMLERTIFALNILAPDLEFVAVPSGTKAYGVHLEEKPFEPPYKESMGRLPRRDADRLFYYALDDVLEEQSCGKKWTWCDVRPDVIIGFAPHGSVYNLAAHWATTYLSLYARVNGENAEVPFPGNMAAYRSSYTQASAQIIAKFSIWASLHPKITGGQVYNISDRARPSTMAEQWPKLASLFGLRGTPPSGDLNARSPTEYNRGHQKILEDSGVQASAVYRREAVDLFFGYVLSFDRHMNIEKAKKAGFTQEEDPTDSWARSFEMMRKAGMILPN